MSPIQKRNLNRPARARLGVSKTTSYDPAAGRTTPATGSTRWNESRYGFRSSGNAVSPTRRFSSPAATIRGVRGQLYSVRVDGTGLRRLTKDAYDDGAPDWQPVASRAVR